MDAGVTDCSGDNECAHKMLRYCPGCRREMWAPTVFGFSHGQYRCQCGYKVETPDVVGSMSGGENDVGSATGDTTPDSHD